nr:hepatocyte growth factor receptor-like [Dermacentor andersoni]
MNQRKNYGGQLPAVVLLTLLTLTLGKAAVAQAALSIETFQLPKGPAQNLLYVNLSRGYGVVVVGGRNTLYALSPDLSLRALYSTGPENDSALCPPHPLPCEHSRNVTDNYNRILLQIGTEPSILACGVTSQGMCSIHDPFLSPNVATPMDKNLTDNYVASKKSTVAFFGTGDDGRMVLFSASAPDGRPAEYRLFTVAARVLNTSGSFRMLSHTRVTSADGSDRLKAAQTLRFVYGFSHNGFAYFVVVQKVQKAFQFFFETRLARVCENDESSFRTYVEVPIMCPPADGALSAATSAYLGPSKSASGGGTGENGSTDFLAVAFGGVPASRMNSNYLRLSSSSSVVCFFDMKNVEDRFRETVENCDKGWSSARLSHLYHNDGDNLKCSHHLLLRDDSTRLLASLDLSKVCRVLVGGRKMLCPGTSLLQFSVISEAELRKHRFAVPAFISFLMDGLHLPPIHLGRGGYFKFDYLPTSELDRYTEQEASANVPLATTRTDNATFAGVKPWYGPAAGGTNITLFGTNLDTGTERSVIIGGGKCTIYSHLNQEMQIVLTIDGTDVPFIPKRNLSSKFTYKPDPIIDDVTPRRSTFSGNFSLEVTGAHLDSVAQPAIVTRVNSLNQEQKENIRKECRVVEGGVKMQCPGTSLMESSVISPSELKGLNDSVLVWISFQMDGLHLPQAIDGGNGHFTFVYQPEPQFMRFPEMERGVDPSELAVEITGNHFELFMMDDEHVLVRVNGLDDACDVTNVRSHSIVCKMKPGVLEQESPCALEVVYAGQSYPVGAVKLMTAEQPGPRVGIIAGSTVATALAAVLTGVGVLLCRRRRQRVEGTWQTSYVVSFGQRHNKSDSLANASNRYFRQGNVDAQQALMEAPFDIDEETRTMLQRENLLIDRGWLHLGRVIGQGHFGCVYRGTIKQDKGQVQEVAVKTLHNNSRGGEVDSTAFLEEALIMKDFHHVNVLPLIGLSIDKVDGLMVITPFMKYGDLLSYIRDDRNTPTIKQLITFGVHVAEGMKYLAETKFVHRDLAARNCMLSEDFIVRVADFGLSRDVYEKDYYSGDNKKTKLPVKWMAPESLEKGIYSPKTDVWSYGVLLWELITRGVTPYPEVDNWDIVDFLKRGRRMKQPSFCPDELYDIMLKCWQEDPKKRPSFAKLVTEIPNLVARLEKKKRNKRLGLNVTYINCPRPQPAEETGSSTESSPI